jgi:FSR family fosmidomycin resistance protein-like MFS transporter
MQSVIPAAYPILKENFSLNFTQIVNYFRIPANGLFIATVYRFYTDKTEALFLAIGGVHHFWIGLLSIATQFWMILVQFPCGYWFIDISSRSVTRRFLGSGGKEVWPNPSSVRW